MTSLPYRRLLVPLIVICVAFLVAGIRTWQYAPWVAGSYWISILLLILAIWRPRR